MTTALSDKEVGKVWRDLQRRMRTEDPLAERDAAVFALIVFAGLKPCECAALNVEDVVGSGRPLAEVRVVGSRQLPSVTLPGIGPVSTSRRARIVGQGEAFLLRRAAKLHTEERGAGLRPFIHREVKGEFRRLTRWTIRDCWLRAVSKLRKEATCDDGRAAYAVELLGQMPFGEVMESMGITHQQTLRKYVGLYKAAAVGG